MKAPVSLDYVIAVLLLAVGSAVLSYVSPNPIFNLSAILLGIYALHLVSLRIVLRSWATSGHWQEHLKGKHAVEIRAMRDELERDRAELENRKAELQQRIDAAEQQWELLREMIRDRVESGQEVPEAVSSEGGGTWRSDPLPRRGGSGPADPPRIHGRG